MCSRSTRRDFLKTGAQAAIAGAGASTAARVGPALATSPTAVRGASVLTDYAAADHRRRLENVRYCTQSIRTCLRKHLIAGYLPGQCSYNLGEYPCKKPWSPDEWDEQELDKLRGQGIELIQVHEEWSDTLRLFGGSRTTPSNPAGFIRFVDMVHRRGMKLLVYVNSGRFQRPDPDFRPEWAGPARGDLTELCWNKAHCSAASPGWRGYILPRLVRILDDYGVDGFYNDLGYRPLAGRPSPPGSDEVLAFEESNTCDGALADMLALIHAEVSRRGGIVKVHYGSNKRPLTELKIYDYLWVGETVQNGDELRQGTKNYPPYLVPCLDMSRAKIANEDELYLHAIPYMQFPLLLAGRPFTGQRALVPGIKYQPEEKCFWTRHCRAIWKRYLANPDGPHSYGWWDSSPGRPDARPTHDRWLKRYLPLVEEGTWAWLEVGDSDLFAEPLPRDVVVSVFANRNLYVALANYGQVPASVRSNFPYVAMVPRAGGPANHWDVPARSLVILQRSATRGY